MTTAKRPLSLPTRAMVERFVEARIYESGAWSPGRSDGLPTFRVSVDEPERLQLWGTIWSIEQQLYTFCLEISAAPDAPPGRWNWTLYFDPIECSNPLVPFRASQRKHLYELLRDPAEAEWACVGRGQIET